MTKSGPNLRLETLQEQLGLFKAAYEEMIVNQQEFDTVKPLLLQIRKLEKAIRDLSSDQAASIFPNAPEI
jgi:hypothetical protein